MSRKDHTNRAEPGPDAIEPPEAAPADAKPPRRKRAPAAAGKTTAGTRAKSDVKPREAKLKSRTVALASPADSIAPAVSAERRRALIARAAYYRAEKRGFAPGGETHDWLQAEHEVDLLLLSGKPLPA
jgi:hypothetical protein